MFTSAKAWNVGFGQQAALHQMDADVPQEVHFGCGFNAFCDDLDAHVFAQAHQAAHDDTALALPQSSQS
jgi:hypothetical protein